MIIGVDAGCLGVVDNRLKAGVYVVAYHLLLELSHLDKTNTYYLYSFSPIEREFMKRLSKNFTNTVVYPKQGFMQVGIPLQSLLHRIDVFLGLSQSIPVIHPFYTIGFVHGLDLNTSFHSASNYKKLFSNSVYMLNHANKLATSSNFLKDTLRDEYHKQAVVIPLGVDTIFFTKTKPYVLDRPYFLFVGTLKASKNIIRAIEAFAAFKKITKKPFYFLFIGSDFWADTNIKNIVFSHQLEKDIIFIPYVEHTSLPTYYHGACAFVSPSLYEGFGLPYLEALAQRTPIIASHNPVEKELLSKYAVLVDPKDIKEITKALSTVAFEGRDKNKIENGVRFAKKYTWNAFAQKMLALINEKNTYNKNI